MNNNTPHLKSPKNQKEEPLGTASNEITGGLELVGGRPTLALGSVLVHEIKQIRTTKKPNKTQTKNKAGSWY